MFGKTKEESPDMDLIKRCLQDAGLYDETMGPDDLLSYYNAIKSSESTANEENMKRDGLHEEEDEIDVSTSEPVLHDIEPPPEKKSAFAPKMWSFSKRSETMTSKLAKRCKIDDENDKLSTMDVYESLPTSHEPLRILRCTPKYMGPFYCQTSLNKLSIKERVKLISNYHLALSREIIKYQRNSLVFAEWGKPIASSTRFNGDLNKNIDKEPDNKLDDILEADSDTSPVMTTRCGRQVKRKFYTECEVDIEYSDDEQTKSKKTKPYIPDIPKKKCETITSQSSPNSRTENILTLIKRDRQKKIEAEKVQDKFVETLADLSDDDEIKITSTRPPVEDSTAESKDGEKGFRKMIVIPPLPHARKNYRRLQVLQPVAAVAEPLLPSTSLNGTLVGDEQKKVTTPRLKKKVAQTKCPICSQTFFTREIEAHASTCGLTNELEIENNLPMLTGSRITCEVCDKVLLLDTDYEVHVQQCIAAAKK